MFLIIYRARAKIGTPTPFGPLIGTLRTVPRNKKASWRRPMFGLLSVVPTNGSKGRGTPTISLFNSRVTSTFGFNCT